MAGPIERSTNLLPQFTRPRTFDYCAAVDGCRQMLWGFFKKMVIADNCAAAVNSIWATYDQQSGLMLILGALFFTFQIYGDFSGYSDIAIGVAKLFGINLKRNFNFPYFSRDIAEFWRRWHISLTTWFRDYIYIPLGGSRCARWKVMRNTLIIFLVSGLWHGANWTFIVWGLYHALLFFPLLWAGRNRQFRDNIPARWWIFPSLSDTLRMLGTFILAVIGWVIFRAETITQAGDYLARIITSIGSANFFVTTGTGQKRTLLFIALLLLVEWLQRDKQHALQLSHHGLLRTATARWAVYAGVIIAIYLYAPQEAAEFIYFQF